MINGNVSAASWVLYFSYFISNTTNPPVLCVLVWFVLFQRNQPLWHRDSGDVRTEEAAVFLMCLWYHRKNKTWTDTNTVSDWLGSRWHVDDRVLFFLKELTQSVQLWFTAARPKWWSSAFTYHRWCLATQLYCLTLFQGQSWYKAKCSHRESTLTNNCTSYGTTSRYGKSILLYPYCFTFFIGYFSC